MTKIGKKALFLFTIMFASVVAGGAYPAQALPTNTPVTAEEVIPWSDDGPTEKGETTVLNGSEETLQVHVTSWRDLPFQTVKRQAMDYSCGSAAIATLLTYGYHRNTSERSAFEAMFNAGDQDKIRHEGFSLLDMSLYLRTLGYKANGYKTSFQTIEKNKIPFIALINNNGYNHFVVVKSLQGPFVLVGDPSKGNVVYSREAFSKIWNGLALIITNNVHLARSLFNDSNEWHLAHAFAPRDQAEHAMLDSVDLPYPNWQIAPTLSDPLSMVSTVLTNGSLHVSP